MVTGVQDSVFRVVFYFLIHFFDYSVQLSNFSLRSFVLISDSFVEAFKI